MNRTLLISIILTLFCGSTVFSQIAQKLIRKGNSSYNSGNYKDAEISYRKSLEKDSSNIKGNFNLGDAQYKQGSYTEAAKTFVKLLESSNLDKETKAKIYHNIGNSLLQEKKYEESIAAYKNALRNSPNDADTKYNLEWARKKLIQQKQQQQNKDNKENKDKKDQNKDSKENKDINKDQDKKDQNKDNNDNKNESKNKQEKPQISKKDAEKMLDALNNKDKNLQDDLNKQKIKTGTTTIEKDW